MSLHLTICELSTASSDDSKDDTVTPIANSPCEHSREEWHQIEIRTRRFPNPPIAIVNNLVKEIEEKYGSDPRKESRCQLPPPNGIYGSSLQSESNDPQSLSTKITRITSLIEYYQLEFPKSSILQKLTEMQPRNETTTKAEQQSEIERTVLIEFYD